MQIAQYFKNCQKKATNFLVVKKDLYWSKKDSKSYIAEIEKIRMDDSNFFLYMKIKRAASKKRNKFKEI